MAKKAAQAGYPNPGGLFSMTPQEIDWALTAFAARRQREMEQIDLLAWLTGRYAAIGVNAPGKYPRRPNAVKSSNAPMRPEDMKQVFVNLAQSLPII